MSDVTPVGRQVSNVKASPRFDTVTKVVVKISDTEAYESGDDSGRTLEVSNPWGSQKMADAILARLHGFQYSPYDATGAVLDPASEMGDFANLNTVFGGIFSRRRNFGRLMKAEISAPTDEEINHEYRFETPEKREYTRMFGEVRASIAIEARQIRADVVAKEGGNSSSFGWALNSDSHRWYANGNEVMAVTASGLTVKGQVEALSGRIGGFTIGASSIYNGISSLNEDTDNDGVYIGTNGIRLGSGFKVTSSGAVTASNLSITGGSIAIGDNFRVTSQGNVTANNMTLTGTLTVGGSTITADRLRQGAADGYDWQHGGYGGYSSPAAYSLGGAGYGINYNQATQAGSGRYPGFFRASTINVPSSLSVGSGFYFRGSSVERGSMIVTDGSGSTQTIRYLSW